jgi:large subunit ribosomal protein L23
MTLQYDIIIRPVVTEKTNIQKEAANQVTFEVDRRANRIEVRRAIERIFNVRVANVRTMQVRGKFKRRGRVLGKRRDWKKAIVTLRPGERIEFFEGV